VGVIGFKHGVGAPSEEEQLNADPGLKLRFDRFLKDQDLTRDKYNEFVDQRFGIKDGKKTVLGSSYKKWNRERKEAEMLNEERQRYADERTQKESDERKRANKNLSERSSRRAGSSSKLSKSNGRGSGGGNNKKFLKGV